MIILYGVVVQHIDADDNTFLIDKLRAARVDLADKKASNGGLLADEVPIETADYFMRVLDRQTGQVLAERPEKGERLPPPVFPSPPPDGQIPVQGVEYKSSAGNWFLMMSALAELDHAAPQSVVLQIAQDRSDDKAFTKYFGELLLAVLAGGVACSAAVALLVAQRALRPLEEMATAMERVQASRLQQSLHRGRWPKELTSLTAAFDEMLARLKESFERLSRFSADLAHELRTPIQNLRGEAEVALTRTRTAAEYREVIELSSEEYQRLASMIDSLLFLARAENAETLLNRVMFEIGPEIDTILDFYDAAAREQEITLRREGEAYLCADPMLFRRAVSNLVSNVPQYTSTRGRIIVLVVQEQP